MKPKTLSLTVLFLVAAPWVSAQSNAVLVKAGDDVSKTIPKKEQLRYPEFQDGQLVYPQGKRSNVIKLNYNLLVGAMQFIDHKGDTLFIPEDSNIFKYVQINRDLYYHDFMQGYFEILTREDPIKLLGQTKWRIVRKEAVVNNGYGNSSSVSNTEYSSRRSDVNTFVQNENSLFKKELYYFLLGRKDKIYKANKAGFVKAFAEYKKQVRLFFADEEIDFQNEGDLKKLLEFCNTLDSV